MFQNGVRGLPRASGARPDPVSSRAPVPGVNSGIKIARTRGVYEVTDQSSRVSRPLGFWTTGSLGLWVSGHFGSGWDRARIPLQSQGLRFARRSLAAGHKCIDIVVLRRQICAPWA